MYTQSAVKKLLIETRYSAGDLSSMASVVYHLDDVGAAIASGSFRVDGMIVVPCSIKTLSAIADSFNYNLRKWSQGKCTLNGPCQPIQAIFGGCSLK
ncbi:MAG: flavoprotein [Thermodesulfobacteriota bacterium]